MGIYTKLFTTIFWILSGLLLIAVGYNFLIKLSDLGSNILYRGDYYINYESGFVRRGFVGEIIYKLSLVSKISPWKIQKNFAIITIALFILLTFYSIRLFKIPIIAVFSFSCLYIPIIFTETRGDHLLLILFLLNVHFLSKNKYLTSRTIIFQNLILLIGSAIHELFFIFSFFPLLFYYFFKYAIFKKNYISKIKVISSFFLIPSLFFLLILCHLGNQTQKQNIINSWGKLGLEKVEFSEGIFEKSIYLWSLNLPVSLLLIYFFIIILHFVFILSTVFPFIRKKTQLNSFSILLFCQFLTIIFVSIFAIDFARWIYFASFTSIFFFFALRNNFEILINKSTYFSRQFPGKTALLLYFLLPIPFTIGWDSIKILKSTPVFVIYDFFQRLI